MTERFGGAYDEYVKQARSSYRSSTEIGRHTQEYPRGGHGTDVPNLGVEVRSRLNSNLARLALSFF